MKISTLVYLIAEHARLTILSFFSTLLPLNRSCSLNHFEDFFHPACLLDPAFLIFSNLLAYLPTFIPSSFERFPFQT